MTNLRTDRFATFVLLATIAPAVGAHHSQAEFDTTTIATIEGVVGRYEFTNPHVYIYLESVDDAGSAVTWELEASSTPNLVRRGWGPDSLNIGDRVSVRVNPPRDDTRHRARAITVARNDGTRLVVRGDGSAIPPAATPVAAASLEGTWLGRYGLAQVGRDLDTWPLTAKGRAAQAAYDGTQNPQIDCVPVAAPLLMLYSNIYEIALTDRILTIDSEWMNTRRVVYLDGRRRPDTDERSNQGHSIGRWEGDALVVETTLFADSGAGNAFEIPSGAQKRLIERLSLGQGGAIMNYEFTLEDPEYLSERVTGQGIWDYRPDLEALPNRCDPEIARRFLQRD